MINGHPLNEQRIIDYKIQIQADAKLWTVYDAADMIATIDALLTRVADLEREVKSANKATNIAANEWKIQRQTVEQQQQTIDVLNRQLKDARDATNIAAEGWNLAQQTIERYENLLKDMKAACSKNGKVVVTEYVIDNALTHKPGDINPHGDEQQ